jgi:hypothetical protein
MKQAIISATIKLLVTMNTRFVQLALEALFISYFIAIDPNPAHRESAPGEFQIELPGDGFP